MSLLSWCIIAHLIGDYLVQTEYEALNKAEGRFFNRALFAHCFKYTACFVPVFIAYDVALPYLLVVLGTHLVLDRRWLVTGWRHYVNRNSYESIKATFWLTIVVDQIFHVLVIVAIACLVF